MLGMNVTFFGVDMASERKEWMVTWCTGVQSMARGTNWGPLRGGLSQSQDWLFMHEVETKCGQNPTMLFWYLQVFIS